MAKVEKKHREENNYCSSYHFLDCMTNSGTTEHGRIYWQLNTLNLQTKQRILRSYPYPIMHLKTNMEYRTNRNVYWKIKEKLSQKFRNSLFGVTTDHNPSGHYPECKPQEALMGNGILSNNTEVTLTNLTHWLLNVMIYLSVYGHTKPEAATWCFFLTWEIFATRTYALLIIMYYLKSSMISYDLVIHLK